MQSGLEQAWERCFLDLDGSRPPPWVFDELKVRYSEQHRAYHTLQHLDECFGWFEQVQLLAYAKGEVAFALFYHDAIYDTRASDNERRSAELALSVLTEHTAADSRSCDRIESLILATRHAAQPRSQDERLLADIDLAILGSAPKRFDQYERQIRQEYGWVEDEVFRAERSRLLRQFLNRTTLYDTAFFREKLEEQARLNLARSLDDLANQNS
jgi:predicted metal-dependent HD superfamily phosphohydrolase